MSKIINIAGRDVGFDAPASLPVRYRNMTGRDFFVDMQTLTESTDTVKKPKKLFGKAAEKEEAAEETRINEKWDTTILFNIAHSMAKAADPSITSDLIDWVDSFEEFPIFQIFAEIQPLIVKSMQTTKKSTAAVMG